MIPRMKRTKKIRKVITSIRQHTLLGEVVAGKKKARRGHALEREGNLAGYATVLLNESEEVEEEEYTAGNHKQLERNPVGGIQGWGK